MDAGKTDGTKVTKNTAKNKNRKMYAIRYIKRITRIRSQTKEIHFIERIKPLNGNGLRSLKRDTKIDRVLKPYSGTPEDLKIPGTGHLVTTKSGKLLELIASPKQ